MWQPQQRLYKKIIHITIGKNNPFSNQIFILSWYGRMLYNVFCVDSLVCVMKMHLVTVCRDHDLVQPPHHHHHASCVLDTEDHRVLYVIKLFLSIE